MPIEQPSRLQMTSDEYLAFLVRRLEHHNPGVVFDGWGRVLKDRRVDTKPIIEADGSIREWT